MLGRGSEEWHGAFGPLEAPTFNFAPAYILLKHGVSISISDLYQITISGKRDMSLSDVRDLPQFTQPLGRRAPWRPTGQWKGNAES